MNVTNVIANGRLHRCPMWVSYKGIGYCHSAKKVIQNTSIWRCATMDAILMFLLLCYPFASDTRSFFAHGMFFQPLNQVNCMDIEASYNEKH